MKPLQNAIQHQVHKLVGFGSGAVDLDHPAGDPGLFGPGSACWRVHGDFTSMMIGGVTALLLQMLHPSALAGVWDHSAFREDMAGRLRMTAQFISGTTYGPTAEAMRLIEKVRKVHSFVSGTREDGTPYSASDPELLTWVHVAEMHSFLAAWQLYGGAPLARKEQDLYYAETAQVARLLGAGNVPETVAEVEAYLERMRPELRSDARTRSVSRALFSEPAPTLMLVPFREIVMAAARDLLPPWAARMHGFDQSAAGRAAARQGVRTVAGLMRWALRDGSAIRARRRVRNLPPDFAPVT